MDVDDGGRRESRSNTISRRSVYLPMVEESSSSVSREGGAMSPLLSKGVWNSSTDDRASKNNESCLLIITTSYVAAILQDPACTHPLFLFLRTVSIAQRTANKFLSKLCSKNVAVNSSGMQHTKNGTFSFVLTYLTLDTLADSPSLSAAVR